jgi:hypothetical protein
MNLISIFVYLCFRDLIEWFETKSDISSDARLRGCSTTCPFSIFDLTHEMENQVRICSPFTPSEDIELLKLVSIHGTMNWLLVSRCMESRTVRECRERWESVLSPCQVNGAWSPLEDRRLHQLYQRFGPKWSWLTTYFPGRSDHNIKNRWRHFVRTKSKEVQSREFFTAASSPSPPAESVESPMDDWGSESFGFDEMTEFQSDN